MDTDTPDPIRQALDRAARAFDLKSGRTRLWARLGDLPTARPISATGRASRPRWQAAGWGVGAVAAALVGLYVAVHGLPSLITNASNEQEFATGRGERATVRLADGSQVTLAPESRLRELRGAGGAREVYLTGEATFSVVHDAAHPFHVRARDVVTEDIGTRFDVRAYPEDSLVRVAVAEGEVAVRSGDQGSVDAKANTLVEVSASGTANVNHDIVSEVYLGWTEDRLTFDRVPLEVILRALNRWYGVDFRVSDPVLAKQPFTLALDHATASHAEEIIAFLAHARARHVGTAVTFAP